MQAGELVWIGLRSKRNVAIITPSTAVLVAERGITGDHYDTQRNGPRQVTLVGIEDLASIASFLGRDHVTPEMLRRNFVTRGVNLVSLKNRRFQIGPAFLEWSGDCAPCSRMEAHLGPGGYNAVRGHGGITARILTGSTVRLGDAITVNDRPVD